MLLGHLSYEPAATTLAKARAVLGLDGEQTMSDWPRYKSHKVIQAMPIMAVTEDAVHGRVIWVRPNPAMPLEPFATTVPAMAYNAEAGDYAVVYDVGGYKSISPKGVFEDGYTLIDGGAA